MIHVTDGESLHLPFVIVPVSLYFFSSLQRQNLIKFEFDVSNGSRESDGE